MISTVDGKIIEMILNRDKKFTDFNFKPSTWEDVFVVELLRWYDAKIEIMPDIKRIFLKEDIWIDKYTIYYEQIVRILYYFVIYKHIQKDYNLNIIFEYLFPVNNNDSNDPDISAKTLMKKYNNFVSLVNFYKNDLHNELYDNSNVNRDYIDPLIGIWNTKDMKKKFLHIKIDDDDNVSIDKNIFQKDLKLG